MCARVHLIIVDKTIFLKAVPIKYITFVKRVLMVYILGSSNNLVKSIVWQLIFAFVKLSAFSLCISSCSSGNPILYFFGSLNAKHYVLCFNK